MSDGVNLDLFQPSLIIAKWNFPECYDSDGFNFNVTVKKLKYLVSLAANFVILIKREPRKYKAPAY